MLVRITRMARETLDLPPVYQKTGRRLLHVSREVLRRVQLCGFAYQLTGDKELLAKAEAGCTG